MAKSLDDLAGARVLAASGHAELALYHCQQAGEKALKAFLTFHQQPLRKTHSLKDLGESCSAIDPSIKAIAVEAAILTSYAWKLRYPGDLYDIAEGEVAAMIALAGKVVSEIGCRLAADNEADLTPISA